MSRIVILGVVVLVGVLGFLVMPEVPSPETVDQVPSTTETVRSTGSVPEMYANGQDLTEIPSFVFEKTPIEALYLQDNQLTGALPAEIRHLQNLRVLDISNNQFTGIPAEVGQLTKLEVLNVSNNPITGLPYEIGNLKNLQVFDLRGTNYSVQDLEIIKKGLPSTVQILTD